MSKNKPKSLSQLVGDPSSAIGRLASTARDKQSFVDHIRNGLTPELAEVVMHCSVEENGILMVRTASSAWAARLQYETEKLLELARDVHPETTSVRVRVAYPED